jgi:biopolymer transport protein TolQ
MAASSATGELGILNMMLNAGPMVKTIMASLLGLSVLCWGIIVIKSRLIRKANKESEQFIAMFAKRKSFEALHKESEVLKHSHLAHIFQAAHREMIRVTDLLESKGLQGHKDNPEIMLENVGRSLHGAAVARRKRLERLLPVLATTGSTSPFIGLFGTVWGIMTSFQEIGMKGSANLAVVAPGISEALVATAIGLAAAIPAVVAYNHFSNKIRSIDNDMIQFTSDFLNTLRTDLMCQAVREAAVPQQRSAAR